MKNKGQVYFKNKLAGEITKNTDASFLFSYLENSPSVSLTMPSSQEKYHSDELFPFFDGLIPEGWLLDLVHKNWKISKNDRMSLLLTACRDCIGATHVLNDAESPSLDRGFQDMSSFHSIDKVTHIENTMSQCLVCMEILNSNENLYHSKCAMELFGFSYAPQVQVSITDLERLALMQLNQRLTLTGVQKKLSLSVITENRKAKLTVVNLDGRFILKPSTEIYPEMALIEHLSMKLAKLQDIPVASCGLVYLNSGQLAYLTKRFDRNGSEKILMEDFCQLSQKSTEKKYTGSTEGLGKVIDQYSAQPQDDKLTLFQMILFSFWIGNADMHLKNFSLWREPSTQLIRMSPGYDFLSTRLLIPESEDNEEMALPINGRKNKLRWSDFISLGKNLGIQEKVLLAVRDKMLDQFFVATEMVEKSFLSENMKEKFLDILIERSERLGG